MVKKRGTTNLSLVLGIDKPAGLTSHDVVNLVRNATGERRVGHMGTLDPMARGVMCVCVGPATRLNPYLVEHDKTYELEITFGATTTTHDAEGEVLERREVPQQLFSEAFARESLVGLVGEHEQVPPAFSAIKVGGKKAYEQARKGSVLELEPRRIEIYSAEFLGVESAGEVPVWRARMSVSKGTYIRSIARDLGEQLGCGAHLSALERLELGGLQVADCISLEQLEADFHTGVVDPLRLLPLAYTDASAFSTQLANGGAIPESGLQVQAPLVQPTPTAKRELGDTIAMLENGRLRALYAKGAGGMLKPKCVFAIGVERG